jgi:hypothetical protein
MVASRCYHVAVVLHSGRLIPLLAAYLVEDCVLGLGVNSRAQQRDSGSQHIRRLCNAALFCVARPDHINRKLILLLQAKRFEGCIDVFEMNVERAKTIDFRR